VKVGDEVCFKVLKDSHTSRLYAGKVQVLPSGSISFDRVDRTPKIGVVIKELVGVQPVGNSQRRTRPSGGDNSDEPYGGKIFQVSNMDEASFLASKYQSDSGAGLVFDEKSEGVYDFKGRDVLLQNVFPSVGDVVEFNSLNPSASPIPAATNIKILVPGGPRETGTVVVVRDSYGFLKCASGSFKQLFFHFSEVLDANVEVKTGMNFEFSIFHNDTGKPHATRLKVLPDGAVLPSSISDQIFRGVILQSLTCLTGAARRKSRETGQIQFQRSPDSPIEKISYRGSDTLKINVQLVEGDDVEFRIVSDKRNGNNIATNVRLVKPFAEGRMMGVICGIKQNYGFVRCAGRDDSLFFHFNQFFQGTVLDAVNQLEVPDEDSPALGDEQLIDPQIGDVLEFNIALDSKGQDNAVRIRFVVTGVQFIRPVSNRVIGRIVQEPGRYYAPSASGGESKDTSPSESSSSSLQQSFGGAILLQKEFGELMLGPKGLEFLSALDSTLKELIIVSFATVDFRDPQTAVREGDMVEFSVVKAGDNLDSVKASVIDLMPKTGIVSKVSANHGTIQLSGGETPELVNFQTSEVENGVAKAGDEVLINSLVHNTVSQPPGRSKIRRSAKSIMITKSAPASSGARVSSTNATPRTSSGLSPQGDTLSEIPSVGGRESNVSGTGSARISFRDRNSAARPPKVQTINAQGPDGTKGFTTCRRRVLKS
jgi:cold shock CspA family protein